MGDIDQKTVKKLGKLLPMLSSNHAGEVVAAVSAIGRTLCGAGLGWHDLTAALTKPPATVEVIVYRERVVVQEKIVYRDPPEPEPCPAESQHPTRDEVIGDARRLLLEGGGLTDKQRDFVENVLALAKASKGKFHLSDKQWQWFRTLCHLHLEKEGEDDGEV
ncbi:MULTISPECIES: hypothetical protein [Agrobacterium]|uniref:hypothetical protein n=1 Tax=Agrobacterium TaxID=357 RepID=UPI0009BA19BA|nr:MULTISPECIES: hypothetical protein [Agrobacterium]QCL72141.1 hypothetical protein CFBP5499_00925 [Agrobacterium tumefaciens]